MIEVIDCIFDQKNRFGGRVDGGVASDAGGSPADVFGASQTLHRRGDAQHSWSTRFTLANT